MENLLVSIISALITSTPSLYAIGLSLLLGLVFWALWVTLNVAWNRRRRLGYAVVIVLLAVPGAIIDVLFNKTVAWALFLEWGQESTLSMRLTRYLKTADSGRTLLGFKRVTLAVWIATNLIEPWQRGHIGLEKYGYPAARDAMTSLMKAVP